MARTVAMRAAQIVGHPGHELAPRALQVPLAPAGGAQPAGEIVQFAGERGELLGYRLAAPPGRSARRPGSARAVDRPGTLASSSAASRPASA